MDYNYYKEGTITKGQGYIKRLLHRLRLHKTELHKKNYLIRKNISIHV